MHVVLSLSVSNKKPIKYQECDITKVWGFGSAPGEANPEGGVMTPWSGRVSRYRMGSSSDSVSEGVPVSSRRAAALRSIHSSLLYNNTGKENATLFELS